MHLTLSPTHHEEGRVGDPPSGGYDLPSTSVDRYGSSEMKASSSLNLTLRIARGEGGEGRRREVEGVGEDVDVRGGRGRHPEAMMLQGSLEWRQEMIVSQHLFLAPILFKNSPFL